MRQAWVQGSAAYAAKSALQPKKNTMASPAPSSNRTQSDMRETIEQGDHEEAESTDQGKQQPVGGADFHIGV